MSSIVSLFVSRAKDKDHVFHEIVSVDIFSYNVTDIGHDNATISGVINNLGLSFLTMEWKYPDDEVSGVYKCVANGVDGTGHPMSVVSTSEVTSEVPDTKQLVQVVRSLLMDMDYVLDNTCISGCWQRRLDQMMKARFEISSEYNGHRYLLSKVANLASAPVAQESCELYGGFLAEIDSEEEWLFVGHFLTLSRSTDFILVLIGGTDDGHKQHWVFDRTGRHVTYTKWIPIAPRNIADYSCMYLNRNLGWAMVDYVCFETERTPNTRYLCELPEP